MADRNATQNIWVKLHGAQGAEAQFKSLGKSVAGTVMQYASLTAAIGLVVNWFSKGVQGALEEERAFKRLEIAIGNTGVAYSKVKNNLDQYFNQLERTTRFTDDEAANALSKLLQVTGDYNNAIKGLPIVLNMTAGGMMEVEQAGRIVGMALEGNIEALGRLLPEFRGINLQFLKGADAAKRAEYAFKILTERSANYAKEMATTTGARIEQATKQWDNFWESLGRGGLEVFKFISDASSGMAVGLQRATQTIEEQTIALEKQDPGMKRRAEKYKIDSNYTSENIKRTGEIQSGLYKIWKQELENQISLQKQLNDYQKKYAEGLVGGMDTSAITEAAIEGRHEIDKYGAKPFMGMTEGASFYNEKIEKLVINFDKLEEKYGLVYDESIKGWRKSGQEVLQYAGIVENVALNMSNVWAQALQNQWNEGQGFFQNMVRGFEQMLASMAAQLASRAAIFGIFSLFKGGSALLGGSLTDFLFKNFQHGGSFTVGGAGGADSQMVAFRASPGERVTVTPPVHNQTNNMHFNFSGGITRKQIQNEVIPEIKRAVRLGMA